MPKEDLLVRNVRVQGSKTFSWDVYDKCVRIARVSKIGQEIKAVLGRIKPEQASDICLVIEEVEKGIRKERPEIVLAKTPIGHPSIVKAAPAAPKVQVCWKTYGHKYGVQKGGIDMPALQFQMPQQAHA